MINKEDSWLKKAPFPKKLKFQITDDHSIVGTLSIFLAELFSLKNDFGDYHP